MKMKNTGWRTVAILLALVTVLSACGGSGGVGATHAPVTTTSASSPPDAPGPPTNVELDRQWQECFDGDFAACDDLYAAAPAGSDYELFGATCGGRFETDLLCEDVVRNDAGPTDTGFVAPTVQPDNALRLRRVSVSDPQVNNIEAFSLLVPETWSFTGFVEWRHDIATLASIIVQIFDPTGQVGLESYFLEPNVSSNQTLIGPGQNWGGAIVRNEMSATDYLVQVVIPTYRSGAVVVDTQTMPEVAAIVADSLGSFPGATTYADAARVRIQYEAGGTRFEEDFYTTLSYFATGATLNWAPVHLYSSWAPVGELDAAAPLLQAIVASADVSLLWGANYQVVFDLFLKGQYGAIAAAGELSRYLAKTADEIAAIHRDAYQYQQATYDRVFDSYSRYTRGQDRYQLAGADGPVLLPRANGICQERGATVPTVLLIPLTTPCPSGTDPLSPLSE